MSVAERALRGGEFERTPPHDLAAEQCVLGGMLMSKDAISDVMEVISPLDHYRPAHRLVHEAILELYGRGEPADPVTVSDLLAKRGELARIGGGAYLHTLLASVPTAANAGYYARIVRERAILRRLVEAGTRIVQLGYAGDGDADELVDRAEAEIYGVTERRVSEDFVALAEALPGTLDELDAIGSRGGTLAGVPTGFADLDSLTNGLHPGQMIIIAARPAIGKALALDTPLPTPTGWTTMGEVAAGEQLLGADGRPVTVVAATETMHGRPCHEVEFSDGEIIVADAHHQWLTCAAGDRMPRVVTTEQIAASMRPHAPSAGHRVPTALPLDLPDAVLPAPAYDLGLRLGTAAAQASAKACGGGIPARYQRGSLAQRRALLAGLADACGTVTGGGDIRLDGLGARLAEDVRELLSGLGHCCQVAAGPGEARQVSFAAPGEVFRVPGKRQLHAARRQARPRWQRAITAVRAVPSRPVRCVQVDSADSLYLAGRSMIPTHNSTLALDLARAASLKHGLATVMFSLEMSRNEITMRLLSAESRVPLHAMRTGQMGEEDWTRLARRMSEVVNAPLFIDDSPNMSLMEIRAKCRRLKQRHNLRLVIVDYLQLMSSPRRVENRQQEVSEMSRSLKLLAKELDVPVVAISQLNRGPEQRNDKRPLLSDLRESGCLTADTALIRADTGAPVTFAQLSAEGHDGISVWSLDARRRLVAAPLVNVFTSGVKEVFLLQLASGRQVKASGNHQFLTFNGWARLDELAPGDRLAIPRRMPAPMAAGLGWSERRLGLLAHLIGDGCVLRSQPVHYTSQDEANLAFVERAAAAEFGITARRVRQGNWSHVYLPNPVRSARGRRNPLHDWFADLGIGDRRSHEKQIPDVLFRASDADVATFLRHLWATDGRVAEPSSMASGIPSISYSTNSRALADGVALLLARFGIVGRIGTVAKGHYRPDIRLTVQDGPGMRTFCQVIGAHGARGRRAERLLAELEGRTANTNTDTIPASVWKLVEAERRRRGLTTRQFQAALGMSYCGTTLFKSCPSRGRLMRCAEVLDSEPLRIAASTDVFWDRITAIEPLGQQPVYDATVKGSRNFIADGIVAHNSLEQDSDVVILLHREDAYERESPRAGEVDLIVAKHRNGPTAVVTVAAQLHLSRFADMAPQ